MADGVLLAVGQLGRRAAVGEQKDRVIAEAAIAPGLARHPALPAAQEDLLGGAAGPPPRDHRDVRRAAARLPFHPGTNQPLAPPGPDPPPPHPRPPPPPSPPPPPPPTS